MAHAEKQVKLAVDRRVFKEWYRCSECHEPVWEYDKYCRVCGVKFNA